MFVSGEFPAFEVLAGIWVGLAPLVLIAGLVKWDPVERVGGTGIGPRINSRWGWFVMEVPALLTFPVIYFFGPHHHFVGHTVVALWGAHYTHRALIWPWIVPRRDSKMRVTLCASGIVFNVLNGGLWGWFMGYIADYANDWMTDPRFVIGVTLAISGGMLNIWSDYRLRRLRMDNGGKYVIPRGGVFNLVSCPNLLGEIIEWVGFALLSWSLPGLAFALWTIANMVPRALWRHAWYRETFENYPLQRRAILPRLI